MTSRERVLTALDFREPDRVPLYFGGTSSFLTDGAYFALRDHLGLDDIIPPYRMGHTGNYVDNRVLEALGVDVRMLQMRIGLDEVRLSPDTILSDWNIPLRTVDGYGTRVNPPFADIDPESNLDAALERIQEHPWPDPYDSRRVALLADEARRLRDCSDAALVARSPQSASFLEYGCWLRGDAAFYMDFHINPDFVHALLDRILGVQKGFYEALLDAVGQFVDIVETSEDYGTQDSLLVSPDTLRKFIFPRRRELNRFIRSRAPGARILHHSCGSVRTVIPDLIDAGVDILNPIQPTARDMNPGDIKDEFGSELVICGGIDMFESLQGGEEQTRLEVELRIEQMAAGGGFLLAPSNHIQVDVPPENVVRLFEIAKQTG